MESVKSLSVDLLYTFLSCYDNYGPEVSVGIVKCLGMLAKIDPTASWSRYDQDTVLSHKIIQFLNSNYVVVRLAAVENLVILFDSLCSSKKLFHYQKTVFEEIYPKVSAIRKYFTKCIYFLTLQCIETFTLEINLAGDDGYYNERLLDEAFTRTASVFHTYASLIVVSNVWRAKSLFQLLKITIVRKLSMGM